MGTQMALCLKINVERCSEYAGSEFKDDPAGAAAAIRTRTKPSNPDPTKPKKDAREVDIIIWKYNHTEYRRKEQIGAQTNLRIFIMVLCRCTQEMNSKLEGPNGWPKIFKDQDWCCSRPSTNSVTSRTVEPPG